MKKINKIVLGLAAVLLVGGCAKDIDKVVANPQNIETNLVENAGTGVTVAQLKVIYEDLKEQLGDSLATKKMLDIIAQSELMLEEDEYLQNLYETRILEKFNEVKTSEEYLKNGVFNEELFARDLREKSYIVTCDVGYGPKYDYDGLKIEDYFLCDYEDVIKRELRSEVLLDLLNEQYIYDKIFVDTTDFLTKKRVRSVEYFSIAKDEENIALDFMTSAVAKLMSGDANFESLTADWFQLKVEKVEEKYNKIGTADDSSFAIYKEFAHDGENYRTIEEGLLAKKREIYSKTLVDTKIFTNDHKTGLSINLVDRILNENVLTTKTFQIGNDYYLLSPLATGTTNANDIIVLDNNNYYFIRVSVINEESSEVQIRDVVEILKDNSANREASVNYYLKKYEIDLHDEDIYEYLKTQYPTIFTK